MLLIFVKQWSFKIINNNDHSQKAIKKLYFTFNEFEIACFSNALNGVANFVPQKFDDILQHDVLMFFVLDIIILANSQPTCHYLQEYKHIPRWLIVLATGC